ncbi:hypothetical protein [Nostoc sp.]|uniref:hypothetical protein n=1 Tax=Nostoc sp. TaxID=1180 RepID=UPI002FFC9DDD
MANITVDKLHNADSQLFQDSESFLNELVTPELVTIGGGGWYGGYGGRYGGYGGRGGGSCGSYCGDYCGDRHGC